MKNNRKIIVICNRTLNLGGIETSLVRVINMLVQDERNEITLVLADRNGPLTNQLSNKANILYLSEILSIKQDFINDIKHLKLKNVLSGLWYRLKLRFSEHFYVKIKCWYKICEPYIPNLGSYDIAIAYSTDYSDLSIVQKKISAKKKVAFLHSDPTRDKVSAKLNDKLLRMYDRVFCVSREVKELYRKVHPSSAEKADVFYNVLDSAEILIKANEIPEIIFDKEYTNILTVGRVSEEKGQDMIPEVVYKLKNAGKKVRWYLVGDGSMREKIEMLIKKYGLEQELFLLGRKTNPYSYMKMCDIYVQPSRSEAFGITVQEAKILHKPVVATDFPGIREQIVAGETGLIVEMTSEAIYKGIIKLMESPEKCNFIICNLNKLEHGTTNEIRKLYEC